MSAIDFPPATIENAQVSPSIAPNRARAAVSGKVVSITLQPNTIAFVSGAVQEAAVYQQLAVVQLFGKNLTAESTDTLDGERVQAYNVLNKENKHAVVYGPFSEKKKIQITLYWEHSSGTSGLQPIDDDEIKEYDDDKLRTKITLIPVFREDQDSNYTLRTVVNCTRMKINA